MYIKPNSFCIPKIDYHGEVHSAVVIFSNPKEDKVASGKVTAFCRMAKQAILGLRWHYERIDVSEHHLQQDCEKLYFAQIAVIDCTVKDPNLYYLLGLAHARGCAVCACYEEKEHMEIPFNVHGRQSLVYKIEEAEDQEAFKESLIKWIRQAYPEDDE